MSKEIAVINFNDEDTKLIKSQIAKDCTDQELKLFLYQCKRTGLDPLVRQIYAIKRAGKMTIQTSIDGFRVIAERSGHYAGQDEPIWIDDEKGNPTKCTVKVYKFTPNFEQRYCAGVGVAYFKEYYPNAVMLQKSMPHNMISKVAEALALRKAFPQDLSGLYTDDEMRQANIEDITPPQTTSNHNQLKNVVKGAMEDMGELCEQKKNDKALSFFNLAKDQVEACGSAEEVEALFEDGKILNKLVNFPKLKIMLEDCKDTMIRLLDPENGILKDVIDGIENDANLIQAG